MRYRNTKTGAIIDVSSELRGNWERIDGVKKPERESSAVSVPDVPVEADQEVKVGKKTRTRRTKK